jgi:hypothetical protein
MYVSKNEAVDMIKESYSELISKFDDNKELLFNFVKEDDWSFVIKTHAFIEAMVTELIITQISDDRIKSTIERLPLSDGQASKLKMAKDLNLLNSNERKFIKIFSSLRNELAHKIENVDFTFEKHIKSLDKNQKKSWCDAISWYAKSEDKEYYLRNAAESPKMTIFIGVFIMAGLKSVQNIETKGHRDLTELANKTMKDFVV